MANLPVILVLVAYYLPGYRSGGPVRTISNMVARLSSRFEFKIVTADRDSFDPHPYPNVAVDDWNRVGDASVFYASARGRSFDALRRLISTTPYDLLYLNSFFNRNFTLYPLLARRMGMLTARPTVIAPRGEFSKGALGLKAFKKKGFISVARAMGLYRDITWHASTELEATDIRSALGAEAQRIVVAQNIPTFDPVAEARPFTRADGEIKVCFLSRVTPKKNLEFALDVLRRLSVKVRFDIYGVIDDEQYWSRCKALIAQMPSTVAVNYCGVIEHERVGQTLAEYDLFLLPTLGENYGHAIFESLAAGTPVLISDATPWRSLESHGVGWDFSLANIDGFVQSMEHLARADGQSRAQQRMRAQEFARRIAHNDSAAESNVKLFMDAIGGAYRS